jgi:hypothetical protein
MVEDKNRARELVEQDARAVVKQMREVVGAANFNAVAFDDPDRSKWPTGDGERVFANVIVGTRDNLTKAAARHCAAMWREAAQRYPKAIFVLNIPGYDDDPRELWEFPEVRRYVRWWARFAGVNDLETADPFFGDGLLQRIGVDPQSPLASNLTAGMGFLAACGVFGEALAQQALAALKPTAQH